jgi:hypothetical protein
VWVCDKNVMHACLVHNLVALDLTYFKPATRIRRDCQGSGVRSGVRGQGSGVRGQGHNLPL